CARHARRCAAGLAAGSPNPSGQFRQDGRSGMSAIGTGPSFRTGAGTVTLGLRANWRQFALLVLINAFVGGMVGIERTVVPLIGSEEFRVASTTLVVSFIVSFGVVKAFANLVSGH